MENSQQASEGAVCVYVGVEKSKTPKGGCDWIPWRLLQICKELKQHSATIVYFLGNVFCTDLVYWPNILTWCTVDCIVHHDLSMMFCSSQTERRDSSFSYVSLRSDSSVQMPPNLSEETASETTRYGQSVFAPQWKLIIKTGRHEFCCRWLQKGEARNVNYFLFHCTGVTGLQDGETED